MPAPYVVDASIWIRIGRNHPPDIFVSLWQKLDTAVAAGDLVSPDEVLQELEQGEDALAESPTPDSVIKCLPSCMSADNPPRYRSAVYRDLVIDFYSANYFHQKNHAVSTAAGD